MIAPAARLLALTLFAACATPPPAPPAEPPREAAPARPPRRPGGGGGAGQRELEEAIQAAKSNDLARTIERARAAIEKNAQLEQAYLLWGSACGLREEDACEAEAYQAGVAALPRSPALHNELGLLYLRQEKLTDGVRELEQACELSGHKEPKLLADLAYAYVFVDRLPEGLKLVERARALEPKSVEAAMAEGEIRLRMKDGPGAAQAFRAAQSAAEDPEVKGRLRRQEALAEAVAGRHAEALAIYQELAQHQRDDALLQVQIAGALMKLERAPEAVKAMQAALRISPDDQRFLSLLLQCQEKAGDKKGAQETKKKLAQQGEKR